MLQILSLLLQVPVLALTLVVILAWLGRLPPQSSSWVMVTLVQLSLLPLLYGAFVHRTRRISDMEITERKERIIPFFVVTFFYLIYLLIVLLFDAPIIFRALAAHFFILALLLSLTTIFWRVSVHVAGATQFVVLLTIFIGSQAIILFLLIVLTAWLRIKMKSHDIWQVAGGVILALVSTIIAATLINV